MIRKLSLSLAIALILVTLGACGQKPAEPASSAEPLSESVMASTVEAEAETTEAATLTETEAAEELQTEAASEAVTEKAADAATTTAASTTAAATEKEEKIPQTKEEIVALFNDAVNQVKPNSKAIVSNYTLNTQTSDALLESKVLQNIANKLISANMGYDKKKANVTYSTAAEKRDEFPVRGQSWSSHLTAADLTKATCTEKDGVYTVTLWLVPDTTPNINPDQGHAGKAFSIITKDSIVEGAGSLGMSVIEENSIKLTFKNCKITAKIDKNTGKLTDVNYFQDWTLSLTALGIDVSVSFGSEDDYTVKW